MATLQSTHVFMIITIMVTFLVVSTSGVRVRSKFQVASEDEETTTITSKQEITTESQEWTTKLPRPIRGPKIKSSQRRGQNRKKSTSSTTQTPDNSTISSSFTPPSISPTSTEASGFNQNSVQPDSLESRTKSNSPNLESTSLDPQNQPVTTSPKPRRDTIPPPIDLHPATELNDEQQSTLSASSTELQSQSERKSTPPSFSSSPAPKRNKNKKPKPNPIIVIEEPAIFPPNRIEISQDKLNIIDSNNVLGTKLLRTLEGLDGKEKKNLLLSPISLFSTLLIVYSGSSSSTQNEMINLLSLKGMTQDQINDAFRDIMHDLLKLSGKKNMIESLNAILIDNQVKVSSRFVDKIRTYYLAELEKVDFATDPQWVMEFLNEKVRRRTYGAINQILDQPPDPLTRLILVNAFYFKGIWNRPFMPQFTTKMPFTNADGSVSSVDTMFQTGPFMFNCDHDKYHVCAAELPYSSGKLSFVAILPDNHTVPAGEASGQFQSDMDLDMIEDIVDGMSETVLEFAMPRLSLEAQYDLLKPLEDLGMKAAFSPQSANFSQMSDNKELFVRQARHKTVLLINEEGSKAAASTIAEIGTRRRAPQFMLNRPFVFLIRDTRTNLILFMGKVNFIPSS
ncbi:iripin-2-like [Brevipalpus obovatus]|uniref:iripin-2-like n=1 Tax=Brevipalpus obovatus TaxID=246614 RepID=UPI003D9F1CC6